MSTDIVVAWVIVYVSAKPVDGCFEFANRELVVLYSEPFHCDCQNRLGYDSVLVHSRFSV